MTKSLKEKDGVMGILAEAESLFYVSSLLLYIQANSDGVV